LHQNFRGVSADRRCPFPPPTLHAPESLVNKAPFSEFGRSRHRMDRRPVLDPDAVVLMISRAVGRVELGLAQMFYFHTLANYHIMVHNICLFL
jgi:hypothetical protein